MPTSSITKTFVVTDPKAIRQLKADLARENRVVIRRDHLTTDEQVGIELFKEAFSGHEMGSTLVTTGDPLTQESK